MSIYLPDGCAAPSDLDARDHQLDDPYEEEAVPEWIGPHCPVCLDTLADSDAVRCFSCGKRQHKACAVVVVEDYYCFEAHALKAALVALKDAMDERDDLARRLRERAA